MNSVLFMLVLFSLVNEIVLKPSEEAPLISTDLVAKFGDHEWVNLLNEYLDDTIKAFRVNLNERLQAKRLRKINRNINPVIQCLSDLQQQIKQKERELQILKERADKVWVTNKKQRIAGNVTVKGNLITSHSSKVVLQSIEVTSSSLVTSPLHSDNTPRSTAVDTSTTIKTLSDRLDGIGLEDVVYKDQEDQTISGMVTFKDSVTAHVSSIDHISNDLRINEMKFSDLAKNTFKIKGNQIITSRWTFANVYAHNLIIYGTINGIKVEDILLTTSNESQMVNGSIKFEKAIVNQLLENEQINGIPLLQFVRKTGKNQVIKGKKVCTEIEARNGIIVDSLDNVDIVLLNNLASRAVELHSNATQIITGSIAVNSDIMQMRDLNVKGLINGEINVTDVMKFCAFSNRVQTIMGPKTFTGLVRIENNITVYGNVNNLTLPNDVVTTNTEQLISGLIKFESVSFLQDLETQRVNGIQLSEEAVRRNSKELQTISGHKTFLSVTKLDGRLNADKGVVIDGVDVNSIIGQLEARSSLKPSGPQSFNKIRVDGDIIALKGINGYQISDLPDILWLKSTNQTINVPVIFEGPLNSTKIEAESILGMKFPQDFVLKNSNEKQIVTGEKMFVNDVTFTHQMEFDDNVKIVGDDTGEMLDFLNGRIELNSNETIFRTLTINGNIHATRVNGLNLTRDVLLAKTEQVITGEYTFKQPLEVELMTVSGEMRVNGTVNAIKLSEWVKDVVLVDDDCLSLRPIRNKNFLGGIKTNSMIVNGTINGVDFRNFTETVVTLNTNQRISTQLTFKGVVKLDGRVETKSLNGMNFSDVISKFADTNSTINGKTTIKGNVFFKNEIIVMGKVNGINITKLVQKAMSRTKGNIIMAPAEMKSHVVMKDLLIEERGKLNGLLVEQLILLTENTTFSGSVIFDNDIRVDGNIALHGTINACDLKAFIANSADNEEPILIRQILKGIDANVDSLDIMKLNGSDTMTIKSNSRIDIYSLIFNDDVTIENLVFTDSVNGKELSYIFDDAVLKSQSQEIRGKKRFLSSVTARNSLNVVDDIDMTGLLSGVDIQNLNATVVRKDIGFQLIDGQKRVLGGVVFEKNIDVHELINNLKVPDDFVLLRGANEVIPGKTVFTQPIVIEKHLHVDGLVDGLDLEKLVEHRRMLSGQEELMTENIEFRNEIEVYSLTIRNGLNNIPVASLLTKDGDYIFQRNVIFKHDLIMDGVVHLNENSRINQVNVGQRTMRMARDHVSSNAAKLMDIVDPNPDQLYFKSMMEMVALLSNYTDKVNAQLQELSEDIRTNDQELEGLLDESMKSPSILVYFELWQELITEAHGKELTGVRFLTMPFAQNNIPVDTHNPFNHVLSLIDSQRFEFITLWRIEAEQSPTCKEYSTLNYKVLDDGTLAERGSNAPNARSFPIVAFSDSQTRDMSFLIWTNTSGCSNDNNEMSLIYRIERDPISRKTRAVENDSHPLPKSESKLLSDARYFHDGRNLFMVAAFSYSKSEESGHTDSVVYIFDNQTNRWEIHQPIVTFGVTCLDLTTYTSGVKKYTFLVLCNGMTVSGVAAPSFVMAWDPNTQKFSTVQTLRTSRPSAVKFIESANHRKFFLVVGNEKALLRSSECQSQRNSALGGQSDAEYYTQPIDVYSFSNAGGLLKFDKIQSIDIRGVSTIDSFHVGPFETYFIAGSKYEGRTYIMQYRGYNLFQEVDSFPSLGVESVKCFWTKSDDLMVAVASSTPGSTKVMKAVFNGSGHKLYKFFNYNVMTDAIKSAIRRRSVDDYLTSIYNATAV